MRKASVMEIDPDYNRRFAKKTSKLKIMALKCLSGGSETWRDRENNCHGPKIEKIFFEIY
jgi:hypothetical protein